MPTKTSKQVSVLVKCTGKTAVHDENDKVSYATALLASAGNMFTVRLEGGDADAVEKGKNYLVRFELTNEELPEDHLPHVEITEVDQNVNIPGVREEDNLDAEHADEGESSSTKD